MAILLKYYSFIYSFVKLFKIYVKVKFTLLFLKGPSLYLKMDLQKRRFVH